MVTLGVLDESLKSSDKELYDLIQREKYRQYTSIELIASENFTSKAVFEANGSPLTNKYSEGLPGARYYGGNQYIDQIENLCKKRALEVFHLDESEWGVNVQPYSGSTANFEVYTALLEPGEKIMGLDLSSGGHLTHGYATQKRKISSSAIYFTSNPYKVDPNTGIIDYDGLEKSALEFKPKLIICGASAYPRDLDYARFRKIADSVGAYLLADISHISGLISSGVHNNAFNYSDVIMTTTHKTLRGPRAALIFFRRAPKGEKLSDLEDKINFSVFPSNQGGPHNNTIAAVATSLKQAASAEYCDYAKQVIKNSKVLADTLKDHGQKLSTDGTDNHLILWDLRSLKLTGSKMEKICELVNISLNKNSVVGDTSPFVPGGVRIGSAAMTSRGLKEDDFVKITGFLLSALQLALEIQESSGPKIKDFESVLIGNVKLKELKLEVEEFAKKFPMPGFDPSEIPDYIVSELSSELVK